MRKLIGLLIVACCCCCPLLVSAMDLYVATASGGDGSKENPFNEIQKAINKAVMGDVIHITQGTYAGKLKIGYLVIDKRGITLAGGIRMQHLPKAIPSNIRPL